MSRYSGWTARATIGLLVGGALALDAGCRDAAGGDPTPDDASADADTAPMADADDDATATASDAIADAMPDVDTAPDADTAPFDPGPAPCGEVDRFTPVFASTIAIWTAQDALGGWPDAPLVVVGSSSIRRWEGMALAYRDYAPLQRGVGGAQLGEIAQDAEALVTRHHPRGVLVFAGTNDLAAFVPVPIVLDRLRCLRHRIGSALGWEVPVLFIGVTPTPARWAQQAAVDELARDVAALAADDPGLAFIDVAPAFLATGSPPDATLFVADGLHLSPKGYDLWNSIIRPAVEAALPPLPPPTAAPTPALAAGTRVLVDLGPTNPEDGEVTPSPDYLGQHWNNWHARPGGGSVLPGEQLVDLVTATGAPSPIDLVVAGGFLVNGRRNGGLLWPDGARLGQLGVGSATGDYAFIQDADAPGALFLRDLDPARTYTVRLFAARDDPEVRKTRYTVTGAATASATLQTSGPGAGHDGATTNDDDVATLTGVRPDAWGQIFIDIAIAEGRFGYLSLLELTVE